MTRDELRLELLKLTLRGAATSANAIAEVQMIEATLFPEDKAQTKSPLTLSKKG